MTGWAITCTLLAAAAELGGIYLVVIEARKATRSLQRWRDANPIGNTQGSLGQGMVLNDVMEQLLGSQRIRWWAVALLVGGVVLGAAGNLLSL